MDKRWLDYYDKTVPKSIGTYPDRTLVDFAAEHARQRPGSTAVAFKGSRLSYRELDSASDALAQTLRADGVRKGDRVALLLPNAPQFVIAALAAWKIGAIVAPQNPIYTERELEESLAATTPETLITLTLFYERVKHLQPKTAVRRVIATSIKEYLPSILKVLFTAFVEKKEGHRVALRDGDRWLQDVIASGRAAGKPQVETNPSDPAVILMSGGTTGTPKGVLSDHRSLVMSGVQLARWLHEPVTAPRSSLMLPLPLFHTYGCAGAQSLAIYSGIPLVLVPNPRDVDDVLKTIAREKPTLFCGVPTLFSAILNHPKVQRGKVDLSSIMGCFSGAAPLMAETKKRFEALTGGRILEGYSLTEATMACCVNPFRGANKIGSIGMPLPDVLVKIVDPEDASRELPVRESGEILLHAPQLMQRYWNNDAETAETLVRGADGILWLHTGDLGYLDEDGYVYIVDRKKDVIKAGGFQVWPREVEEVIASYPAVAEVGVAGLPDPEKGEIVGAWIVLRPGEPTIDVDALRAFCKERLAPYKVPVRVQIRKELPKTMVGKVLRRALVAQE